MQLVDPAFGQCVDADAGELAALVERGQVFRVPGQPFERFRRDDVEGTTAHAVEELLVARAERDAAAESAVREDRPGLPALPIDLRRTAAVLVGDGCLALQVCREARVGRSQERRG